MYTMSNLMWHGNIGASFFSPVCEPPITNYSKMFIFKFVLEWSRGLEEGWIEQVKSNVYRMDKLGSQEPTREFSSGGLKISKGFI